MAEMKISNTLVNDTSDKTIAYAEQLKQRIINWAEYNHVTEKLGPNNRPNTQNLLNNLFLRVYEEFLTFLNNADATDQAINTWKEIEAFLAGYTDDKTLASIVAQLNANIESRLNVQLANETGDSTTTTMTQKAITEAIDGVSFSTGQKVKEVGIDPFPQYDSSGLVSSKAVAAHGSAFDISEYNKNGDTLATYATLTDALAAIPPSVKRGGMSIKFIQSSDNKYVKFRYMSSSTAVADFTNVANWQGVDNIVTENSNNLITSGGVDKTNKDILTKVASINNAPIVKTVTTEGTTAKDTGVTLLASHTYLVKCNCPTAASADISNSGLYYYTNGSFTFVYAASKETFNNGFIAELTPSNNCNLYVRTNTSSDVVSIEVYDITTFEEKASPAYVDNKDAAIEHSLQNTDVAVANLNSAPSTKDVTTASAPGAYNTGIILFANKKYLIRCICATANSATKSDDGLYLSDYPSTGGDLIKIYNAGKEEFNAGFGVVVEPTSNSNLNVRTHANGDEVHFDVYDITNIEVKASKIAFDNEVTKTKNLSIDVATLNSTPSIADTTTTSSGAKNTGIRLTATHKYIIKCSCPSSYITNNAGLYNGDSILIVPITKDEFNAGFFYEYIPDTAQYLFVRTGAADTTVHTEVYDITEFKTKANKEDVEAVTEGLIINSILSDAFGFSNFQYTNGNLSSATIKWFDGTTGTMTITYSGNNISYIDYTYGSSTYRQTINYTNGEITGNQVEKL